MVNGNNRMALALMYVFLAINGSRIKMKQAAIYELAKWVASTPSQAKAEVISGLEIIIEDALRPYPDR